MTIAIASLSLFSPLRIIRRIMTRKFISARISVVKVLAGTFPPIRFPRSLAGRHPTESGHGHTALKRIKEWGVFGMSENTSEITASAGDTQEQVEAAEGFEAIASQEEFDRRIQARLERERKKYSDYDDVKAKADKLEEIENANKTEVEKQREALAEAQAQLAELTVAKTRAEVAAAKGVPADLLSGSTQEELEQAADALIAFRGEQKPTPSSSAIGRANRTEIRGSNADQFASQMDAAGF